MQLIYSYNLIVSSKIYDIYVWINNISALEVNIRFFCLRAEIYMYFSSLRKWNSFERNIKVNELSQVLQWNLNIVDYWAVYVIWSVREKKVTVLKEY